MQKKSLSMPICYFYWEEFVKQWQCGGKSINGWSDPNCIPLYNTSGGNMSSLYIPEPWWGNNGTQLLHSVVINFNPGEGKCGQEKVNFPCGCSYAYDVVGNPSVLKNTRKWHKSKRAMRILNALCRNGSIKKRYCLENHLSVELIPWHTQKVEKSYMDYLKKNILAIYEHSICFAANESRRIGNSILKNVVIVRMNDKRTKIVLHELCKNGVPSKIIRSGVSTSGNGRYMEFCFPSSKDIKDIRFICIWGRKSRNDFPPSCDMDDIIRMI